MRVLLQSRHDVEACLSQCIKLKSCFGPKLYTYHLLFQFAKPKRTKIAIAFLAEIIVSFEKVIKLIVLTGGFRQYLRTWTRGYFKNPKMYAVVHIPPPTQSALNSLGFHKNNLLKRICNENTVKTCF